MLNILIYLYIAGMKEVLHQFGLDVADSDHRRQISVPKGKAKSFLTHLVLLDTNKFTYEPLRYQNLDGYKQYLFRLHGNPRLHVDVPKLGDLVVEEIRDVLIDCHKNKSILPHIRQLDGVLPKNLVTALYLLNIGTLDPLLESSIANHD